MQIIILIYHITGASSQIPIYMHVRILVSSYLFMTGFGNFCYYWQGGELTFRRYCQKFFDDLFLFPLWKFLFVLPGREDEEWWFRWNLDKFRCSKDHN
ncbi:hypothetical protein Anas_12223 [Armadillidium nasatum]|uniref:Cas1p 10 TM acyl transferase domain-containing protein n=1 Tax=Armadillidium nasatum TaxID=96803 RepID=A0A5N5SLW5_9CRUS|nr:hypothetical protein Anas_12223 [Armadillidium nasatum]